MIQTLYFRIDTRAFWAKLSPYWAKVLFIHLEPAENNTSMKFAFLIANHHPVFI